MITWSLHFTHENGDFKFSKQKNACFSTTTLQPRRVSCWFLHAADDGWSVALQYSAAARASRQGRASHWPARQRDLAS